MCVEYSQATMQFRSSHVSCIVCLEWVDINDSILYVSHEQRANDLEIK